MFKVTMRYRGGSKNKGDFGSVAELLEALNGADGYCWTFDDVTEGDDTVEAQSEEADCSIRMLTDEARISLADIIRQIRANDDCLLRNTDDIGTAPVFYITGERDTGWDYQWNPEDPHYDHNNPGGYVA